MDTHGCPCGTTIESWTHIVLECEIYKEERGVLEEMRKLDESDMEKFDRLESSEKTIVIQGDRWWPQTAKQDGDRKSKQFLHKIRKKRNERPNDGGVSIRSRNGAPSRKACVVNGQMTKASNKCVRPSPTKNRPCFSHAHANRRRYYSKSDYVIPGVAEYGNGGVNKGRAPKPSRFRWDEEEERAVTMEASPPRPMWILAFGALSCSTPS